MVTILVLDRHLSNVAQDCRLPPVIATPRLKQNSFVCGIFPLVYLRAFGMLPLAAYSN